MAVAISAAPQAQRFVVLDSFRGLCALSVALFHLHIVGGISELPFFRSAGLFVEFFFTLSGFVLCHGYVNKAFDSDRLRGFLISRACRIFPLHLVLLLAFTLLELVRLWQTGAGFFGIDWNEWLANALLLQAWLPQTNAFSFNGPAWSISVEFYIYLVFGLILFATACWRKPVFAVIALACGACVGFGAGWIGSGGFRGVTCFFTGALAYEAYRRCCDWRMSRWLAAALELAMLAGLYFCLTLHYANKSYLATGFFALFIVLFAREAGPVSRLLQRPVFVRLGHWSFSIYLTHSLLIVLLTQAAQRLQQAGIDWISVERLTENGPLFLDSGSPVANLWLTLMLLVMILGVSSLSYRHVERRGIEFGKRLSRKVARIDWAGWLAAAAGRA